MDAWQEEGQIIFSCLLCCFCSVNQLCSSESKNLFQDVNKSKVIRRGNVIPPCRSSLTHVGKWKLFKDTTWGRLIGADESVGTWSWKCLLPSVGLWLLAWVNSESTCKCSETREKAHSHGVLSGPLEILNHVLRVYCCTAQRCSGHRWPDKPWVLKFKWNIKRLHSIN